MDMRRIENIIQANEPNNPGPIIRHTRPAEKFWVVTPQTPVKFLGQNLFGDHFWGRSEAGKV